ncbi:DUF4132 domain-containing protein [Nocardia sp. NPDC057668]|uniref:DUF4132 domain-containing protein n=1 Tax=Nocardia sp. NPDC057668 TaxID=3346202 RepID=UPI00366B0033
MSDTTTSFDAAPTAEQGWGLPARWVGRGVPTRGVTPPREVRAPRSAGTYSDLVAAHRDQLVEILAETAARGEPGLAAAARAALEDQASCTPLGAAALAHALVRAAKKPNNAAETWMAERGFGFAAEAAVWHLSLTVTWSYEWTQRRHITWLHHQHPGSPPSTGPSDHLQSVREHLAVLPEQEYRAVVTRLAALRATPGGSIFQQATSYLAPTEAEWTAEDLAAATGEEVNPHRFAHLAASVTTIAEFEALLGALGDSFFWRFGSDYLAVALHRFGPDVAPVLERLLRRGIYNPRTAAQVAEILAEFPTDASLAAAFTQIGNEHATGTLISAIRRVPHRALPLLVPLATGSSLARHLLRTLAHAEPELAAQVPPIAAYSGSGHVRQGLPAELPAVLRDPPWRQPNSGAGKPPREPKWLVPETLPAVYLRDSDAVLPVEALGDLCRLLVKYGTDGDPSDIAQVKAAARPEALAEFAWGIFELWQLAGFPAKNPWVLRALAVLGDDETVRRLTPMINVWPGQSAHARAVAGLDVLTEIGTDTALMRLNGIAEKAKFKGLKANARGKVALVAAARGLTADELADLLIPDFGLNADGGLVLDYGPRGFVVGFDEQLKPVVHDAKRDDTGAWRALAVRKSLPKPGAKDDPELAPAAHKRFADLKKAVKTAAGDQIRRFERAMVTGRRWTAADHRKLFVDHPLIRHIARRLVWVITDANDTVLGSFRIAEDRTFADTEDNPITLPDTVTVGIAHPLHVPAGLGAWAELFADYELLQPFPQLQRETYALADADRAVGVLPGFAGITVPTGRLLGLIQADWERGPALDNGVWDELFRDLGDDRTVVIDLSPGVPIGSVGLFAEQTITVRLTARRRASGAPARLSGNAAAVAESELLRQLHSLG